MLKTESAHDRMVTTSKDGIIYAPRQLVVMHETEEDRTQNADSDGLEGVRLGSPNPLEKFWEKLF